MNSNTEPMFTLPVGLLSLPNIVIKETLVDKENRLIFLVESLEEGTRCHQCGKEVEAFHGHGEEIVRRHLPLARNEMSIRLAPKKYRCKDCEAVTTPRLSWYPLRCAHTNAYEDHILLPLVNTTVSDVSIKEQFGYEAILGIIDRRLAVEIDWSQVAWLDIIGLDEISLKKGHQDYVTIVTGRMGDKTLILGVLKELKRLKKELSETEYKKLKGVMWILRKREADLTVADKKTRDLLFHYSPALKLAYESSHELTAIFDADLSKFHAKHKINSWIRRRQKNGMNCFEKFIKTLTKFKDEITNDFVDRNTSGFVEGFNNKIKAIKRRGYGILNIGHFFQRIYLDTGGFSLFLPSTENQRVTP